MLGHCFVNAFGCGKHVETCLRCKSRQSFETQYCTPLLHLLYLYVFTVQQEDKLTRMGVCLSKKYKIYLTPHILDFLLVKLSKNLVNFIFSFLLVKKIIKKRTCELNNESVRFLFHSFFHSSLCLLSFLLQAFGPWAPTKSLYCKQNTPQYAKHTALISLPTI